MKPLFICHLLLQLGAEAEFAAARIRPLPNSHEINHLLHIQKLQSKTLGS